MPSNVVLIDLKISDLTLSEVENISDQVMSKNPGDVAAILLERGFSKLMKN